MISQELQNIAFIKASGTPGNKVARAFSESQGTDPFKSVMESLMSQVEADQSMTMDSLLNLLNMQNATGQKSRNLLSILADNLTSLNGADPSSFTVDTEGLDALGALLKGMGFNTENVDRFIGNRKNEGINGSVSMKQLFSKLGQFIEEEDTGSDLDISALPYIETLMNNFQIKTSDIESALRDAMKDGSGVDLDALISGLKKIQSGQDGPYTATTSGQENLLKGLGLSSQTSGVMTLDEFTRKLENLLSRKNPVMESSEAMASTAKHLNDHIRLTDRQKATESTSIQTNGAKSSGDFSIHFETPRLKGPQALDNADPEIFSGMKQDGLKEGNKGSSLAKEGMAYFEKTLKPSTAGSQDSIDSQITSARTAAGSEIYSKIADMKGGESTEKTLPSYVTEQVARQISKAVKMGDSEITFQIKPPDMGRVQLSIESTREGVKINILTEHPTTRDILLHHSGDLRTLLADQGIRLDKIDVDVSGNFGQSMAQARQDAQNSGKERRGKDKHVFNMDGLTEETRNNESVRDRVGLSKGRLDLVA